MANGALVLLVDDDATVRLVTEYMLEELGHEVLTADSAVEALSLLATSEASRVELVLSDEVMPGLRGSDFLRSVSVQYPHLRLGIMSGYSEGVEDIPFPRLRKPFTEDELGAFLAGL